MSGGVEEIQDVEETEEPENSVESDEDEPPVAKTGEANSASLLGSVQEIPAVTGSPSSLKSNEDAPPAKVSDGQERLIAEEVQNHKANRDLRNKYAGKAYDLACGGLVFWGVATSTNGIVFGITGRQMLSDKVVIAITTGATINVLAAFLGVIRGLFPSPGKDKEEKKSGKDKD